MRPTHSGDCERATTLILGTRPELGRLPLVQDFLGSLHEKIRTCDPTSRTQ